MPKGVVTYIPEDLYEKFRRLCGIEGVTVKDKVHQLIEAWVESNEPPKSKPQSQAPEETEEEDIFAEEKEEVIS